MINNVLNYIVSKYFLPPNKVSLQTKPTNLPANGRGQLQTFQSTQIIII